MPSQPGAAVASPARITPWPWATAGEPFAVLHALVLLGGAVVDNDHVGVALVFLDATHAGHEFFLIRVWDEGNGLERSGFGGQGYAGLSPGVHILVQEFHIFGAQ